MSTSTRFPSPALVVAVVALITALGGSAYAVSKSSVASKHVKNGSLKGVDVRDDSLTGADVNESTLALPGPGAAPRAPGATGSGPPSGPAGGALAGSYPNPLLAANSVGSAAVAPNALVADDLATASVGSLEIGSGAVTGAEVDTDAIDSDEIDDGSLTGADVGRDAGTVNYDPPSIAGGSCFAQTIGVGTSVDLRSDAILVTVGVDWPDDLSLTPGNSGGIGQFVVNICNNNASTVNGPATTLRWLAIDV